MSKLTKKQCDQQEREYAQEMREIAALDTQRAHKQVLEEIEHQAKMERTRDGLFEDAYWGPIVVEDEATKYLADRRARGV